MWTIVSVVFLITLGVVFLFWVIISRKKDGQKDSVTFTCSVCGEHDCVCHQHENIKNHR